MTLGFRTSRNRTSTADGSCRPVVTRGESVSLMALFRYSDQEERKPETKCDLYGQDNEESWWKEIELCSKNRERPERVGCGAGP